MAQGISTIDLCALSFIADVALITSLREGMSKVAFEFILCQARDLIIALIIINCTRRVLIITLCQAPDLIIADL